MRQINVKSFVKLQFCQEGVRETKRTRLDEQGKLLGNFPEIWDKFYSALWDKLLKFGRNYSGIWEKLFRTLGEIQRFRNSEITQKLFRNYSEIISENMRRKNLFRSEFFGTN